MTAGNKAVVVSVNGPLYINWHADSWAIGVTSPLDRTATATHLNPGTTATPVPASGTTATLAQASELVIAAATSKYNYVWGGTYGGAGTPPAGYTTVAGLTEDNVNQVTFHTAYRETTTTGGVSAAFSTASTTDNTTAVIATFKITSVQRRVRVLLDSSVNSDTGITAYAWSGEPDASLASKWSGLSAEASGGILFLTSPPAAWAVGADVNVIAYQPAGDKNGSSWVLGRVEEY
jgi:hypothetical protein